MRRGIGVAAVLAVAPLAVAPVPAADERPLSWVVPQSSPWVGTLGRLDHATRLFLTDWGAARRAGPPQALRRPPP
jgi:hypothetical protein